MRTINLVPICPFSLPPPSVSYSSLLLRAYHPLLPGSVLGQQKVIHYVLVSVTSSAAIWRIKAEITDANGYKDWTIAVMWAWNTDRNLGDNGLVCRRQPLLICHWFICHVKVAKLGLDLLKF